MAQVAKVVIRDAAVTPRTVGAMTFYSQEGFLRTSADEALKIEISLPRGNTSGYPTGEYFIAGESFDRDGYGRPAFGKRGLHLIPVPKGT